MIYHASKEKNPEEGSFFVKYYFRNIIKIQYKQKELIFILNRKTEVPWAILLDLTSAYNLKCTGCWAAEYGNHMNLTYEEMDDIVT